ncbi:MAG: L-threonylcarbamoyladenylate synthase [Planctomycetota bacterium]|nr:L-threonylcarbamoyladenylate synthase [Planctomycetota bacterium]
MPRIAEPTPDVLEEAARRLREATVVAFPTETVYGLGADTLNSIALHEVYELKRRPAHNPLIAHVIDAVQARTVVEAWDDRCDRLAQRFWPGPLTFVLPRAGDVPDGATAGLATIAVRAPRHPVARALIETFDSPVSAPSANRSGHVSPTTARHVADEFADIDDLLILDGGPSELGLESTVLDLTASPPRILRWGAVTEAELTETIGDLEDASEAHRAATSGGAARHYAPRARTEIVDSEALAAHLGALEAPAAVLCFDAAAVPAPHRAIEMPADAKAYAARMYEALREADGLGCGRIVIEKPRTSGDLWRVITDRLSRAAHRPDS